MKALLIALLTLTWTLHAAASFDTYEFKNDAERARYQRLTEELRCPKCQNQDLADSNAPIAKDLRREIFRMFGEGKSDAQIVDFMVDRYGDFVLYKPRLTGRTWLLWFGPGLLLVLGGLSVALLVRRRRQVEAKPQQVLLSADEQARLAKLLDEQNK